MARYSPERKEAILKKMTPPHNMTVAELASQEGVRYLSSLLPAISSYLLQVICSEAFSFSGLSHTSFSCFQLCVLRPFQHAGFAVLAA